MPRASWSGFLRLSLASCPIYLSPATTPTKPIRLRQVWQPAPIIEQQAERTQQERAQQNADYEPSGPRVGRDHDGDDADESWTVSRITLRPHDPRSGEEIDKSEVVKGYEYGRGQFITFSAAELNALDVESSKVIDLETFIPRAEIDPVYFDKAYYLYPDGAIATQALRVIGSAMAEANVVGIGRLTLTRRERMVMVEPRGFGMALFMLRAADEVRPAQFGNPEGDLDAEMVAIAGAIIGQRIGKFDPSTYRDRYQDALRALIETKLKGLPIKTWAAISPPR
jgi:DNA end-binding protein Ku